MTQKLPTVNCMAYSEGACLHQGAPKVMFGHIRCIIAAPSSDRRVVTGCALQVPYLRPMTPITPPPKIQYF